MRYVDRYVDFGNLDMKPEAAAILRATAYNQQLFSDPNNDGEEPTYTTHSIKYAAKDKPRADYRPINEIEGSYAVDYEGILQLLGYEGTALEFQLESWEKLNTLERRAYESGRDQGLVISAPTGFGKTACFFGFVMHRLLSTLDGVGANRHSRGDAAIFVYPTKALLHDQLSRVMELLYDVKQDGGEIPEFGIWYGNTPQNAQSVTDTSRSTAVRHERETVFTGAKYWEDVNDQRIYINDDSEGYEAYTLENHAGNVLFDSTEFYIGRQEVVNRNPNLILTTLESLENIAMKPHYDLINTANYFVFDEIHQYSGLRGSHASNVIQNIKRVRNRESESETSPALFIGSSATIQDPGQFGRRLFGLSINDAVPNGSSEKYTAGDLRVVGPSETDVDPDNEDKQHYYFMLTPSEEGSPGVATQFIQHAMMVGHSLLEDQDYQGSTRSNILSFIDSKSLLRNLNTKFVDADQKKELYRHHFGHEGPGDWADLAKDTGHIPQDDSPLDEPRLVYSGSDHSIDEISNCDLTLGTKFLEVGVDIETLKYIINYREPESVATLKQRAGRAGRESGDAYMFSLLSSYNGDTNFYYRADGFVDQDISTPLRTDNHVVDTVHSWFYDYYCELAEVDNWTDNEEIVLKRFFDRMGWEKYNSFLQSPKIVFSNILDLKVNTDSLLSTSLNRVFSSLEDEIEEIDSYLSEFQGSLEQDVDKVFLQRNAVSDLLAQFQRKLVNEIDTFIELAQQKEEDRLIADLKELRSDISTISLDNPEEAAGNLYDETNTAFKLLGDVRKLQQGTRKEGSIDEEFIQLSNILGTITNSVSEGELQQQNRRKRIAYYLKRALVAISEYKSVPFRHGSLYAVKYLLRGAYYFEKALRVSEETEHSDDPTVMGNIWYVPPNYFADTGWYFELERPGDTNSKESVDKLLTQYLPFKTEYAAGKSERGDTSAMNVFQPDIIRTEDGELEFDFSEIGEIHNGVLIPDHIPLKRVNDVSTRGNKIVPYDSETYEILSSPEARTKEQDSKELGQIYSSPRIATRVNEPTEASPKLNKQSNLLELRSINAQAWIDSINIQITPSKESDGNIYLDHDAPVIEQTISAGNQRVGYSLNTRGISLSIGSLIDRFRDSDGRINLKDETISRHKDLDSIDEDRLISNTAAHFLTMLVADVTGVNTQTLLYGTDFPNDSTDSEEYVVHTFEQIEGGQGVVDLFWDTLDSRPEEVLNSLYRLTRNTQVLNEELWAAGIDTDNPAWEEIINTVDSEELSSSRNGQTDSEEAATEIIANHLGYTYDQTIRRLVDEIRITLDHINQLSQDYDVTVNDLAELKGEIAAARLTNEEQNNGEFLPDRIHQEYRKIFMEIDPEVIRTVFLSPDIDGCEANLHLNRAIFDRPQSEMLSNGVLTEIEQWLVQRVPREDEFSVTKSQSKLSARTNEDYAYFLEF